MNPLDLEDLRVELERLLIGQNQSIDNKSAYAEGTIDMDSNGNLSVFMNGKWVGLEHRSADIGSASGGVHMHVAEEKPKVITLSEEDLDNQTLDAFNEGVQHAYDTLLQALEAEEQELKRYGRTDLYGIHKAIAIVKEKSNGQQSTASTTA